MSDGAIELDHPMSDTGAAADAAVRSFDRGGEWTTTLETLEEALNALDRIGASIPAAHLSLAVETLRLWSPDGEPRSASPCR